MCCSLLLHVRWRLEGRDKPPLRVGVWLRLWAGISPEGGQARRPAERHLNCAVRTLLPMNHQTSGVDKAISIKKIHGACRSLQLPKRDWDSLFVRAMIFSECWLKSQQWCPSTGTTNLKKWPFQGRNSEFRICRVLVQWFCVFVQVSQSIPLRDETGMTDSKAKLCVLGAPTQWLLESRLPMITPIKTS